MRLDRGIVVDVETTGLDPKTDEIIEFAFVEFAVEGSEPPVQTAAFSALAEPRRTAITPEITALTGLTSSLVRGQLIPWDEMRARLSRASIVIAHNMAFDRAFLRRDDYLGPLDLHWACSLRHIPWRKLGFTNSHSLTYLAADHGFLNPFPHRALFDCATTFRLIAPHLELLTRRSYEREYRVAATCAPFEKKDILRSRGYRWSPEDRVWSMAVLGCDLTDEQQFLEREVYGASRLKPEICEIVEGIK
jgi:DNA polymerase III subunit epsilon